MQDWVFRLGFLLSRILDCRFHLIFYFLFSGAFLIVYFIAMTFCGIPIFFQEVAIGQYLGSGGMTLVAQLCPLFKGKIFSIF